ncbi:MAG: orotidine-5'-phosphate decarboxylase [Candidatus Omnitrophica bacterium]|nr:orotidine-5'-phosphate decarboxylase [Candidatus Omnitrophota bacterium]
MKTKLIVALDVDSFKEAKKIVDLLYPKVKIFKVGLRLFVAEGHQVVKWLVDKGVKVFLDLKLYDIPNTMKETARHICRLKIFMFTVHIQAGKEALEQLREIVFEEARRLKIRRPLIIGVTVLTSQNTSSQRIKSLVNIAKEVNLDGIVISVKDIRNIPKKIKKRFVLISPAIRMGEIKTDDQKRIATPQEAKRKEIDYIVMGRPILNADNPIDKVKEILKQLE